jgi:type III secretion protein J
MRIANHSLAAHLIGPLMLLTLAACGRQEVYGQLAESEANEIIATLQQAHISASKKAVDEGEWGVTVASDDFAQAIKVLDIHGLPRDDYESLGKIFEKKGFVSSPLEEHARLIYGLSQELGRTISEIDGVVKARVHLAIPEPDPLSDKLKPSSAAVFVKYQPGYDLRSETGAIKSLVTNSIEGLKYDRVSVVMVPSRAEPDKQVTVMAGFNSPLIALLLIALGIGGLLLAFPIFKRRSHRKKSRSLAESKE